MQNIYKTFFDKSLDYLCIAGFDGYFKELNSAFQELLGLNPDEVSARPFIDFIHHDDISKTLIEIDKLSKGSLMVNFENRFRNADGDYRHLSWNAYPDLELNNIFAISRDYTEKVKADNILQIFIEASPIPTTGFRVISFITSKLGSQWQAIINASQAFSCSFTS